jgi:hypothetical protein
MTMKPLSIETFRQRVKDFPWQGSITEFHVHHTADPAGRWQGAASVEATRRFHVGERGYRDSAQHVLLGPDGSIWLGRDWNWAPASALGHNGKDNGPRPFMVECWGNFLTDRLDGVQESNLILMIAAIQERFDLPPEAIRFHKEMQATQCPGHLDKQDLIAQVRAARMPEIPYDPPEGAFTRFMRLILGQRS